METLIEKIKEEENRLKKLLSTHSCPTVAQSHILGEIDGLQKALELIYEEQYFGKTDNGMNDEGGIACGFISGELTPYQLCQKCINGVK